jgi:lipopolysaccharide export system protein LptA
MKKILIAICIILFCIGVNATEVLTPENWKPKVKTEAIINSDRLDFDYELYIATFTGNVVVQHPQFTGFSDKIVVVFEKDVNETASVASKNKSSFLGEKADNAMQRVKSAVAIGNVKVFGENQMIICDNATYFKDNAMLRLTGKNPPVVKKDGRTISGQVITVWLNDGRIVSSDSNLQIPSQTTTNQQ